MAAVPKSRKVEDEDAKKKMEANKLNQDIAEHYDDASGFWEELVGDHLHHGFYDTTISRVSPSDPYSAQIRMIEAALRFASISDDPMKKPKSIVDVGCGKGGSARYLASKYDAKCIGITLSPSEVQRARALAVTDGLAGKVSFEVADAIDQPFPDGQFDLVWCMESTELIVDKTKLVHELARVAAPGATIIITASCHRDLSPFEQSLHPDEIKFWTKISGVSHSSSWCSKADYLKLLKSLPLQDVNSADWSQHVAPFCPAVMKSAFSWKGITTIMKTGLKGLNVMPLLHEGNKKGFLKYSIITCRKPE